MEQRNNNNDKFVTDGKDLEQRNYEESTFESKGDEGRTTFGTNFNIASTVLESQHQSMANEIVESSKDFAEAIQKRGHRGCDKRMMFLPTSDIKSKKLCCEYCRKQVVKLERHLRFVHKDEAAVKTFLALPLRSKGRRDVIASIRKRGEFIWNSDFELNKGVLQTSRRPNKKFGTNPLRRLACASCMGSYSLNTLNSHWRKCVGNAITGERVARELGRSLEGRIHPDASDELKVIFSVLRDDETIRMIEFDYLVTCYGEELCLNYSPHYQEGYIRSKLRAAAKVLHLSNSMSSEITDMSSLFHVKNCNIVLEAIRKMGKFDRQSKLFGSPGTAATTITLINALGEMLINESMKSDDEVKERNAERFLKVFRREVRTKINKLVTITKAKNRRYKKLNIPTTADIKKLSQFLETEREACYRKLTEKFSYGNWLNLAQLTLVTILVFNRRRAGEMRNITITDFRERELVADQPDMILETISEEMKSEIKSWMIIRGKLGRDVPVLLKPNWEDCIELLIQFRKDVHIPTINDFLFALPTKSMRVRTVNVWAAINSYAKACGAENPSSLKGTNLRKHLASYTATKNLKDRDITNLAHFMGHRKDVHLNIYRNNPLASQVSHLAPLLNDAQGNMINRTDRNKIENAQPILDSDSDFDSDSNSELDSESDTSEDEGEEINTNRIVRNCEKARGRKFSNNRGTKVNGVKKVNAGKRAVAKANGGTKKNGGSKTFGGTQIIGRKKMNDWKEANNGRKTNSRKKANGAKKPNGRARTNNGKKAKSETKSNGITKARFLTKTNGGTNTNIECEKKIPGGQTKKRPNGEAPKKNKKVKVE